MPLRANLRGIFCGAPSGARFKWGEVPNPPGRYLNFAASTDSEISDLLEKASSVKPEEKAELLSRAYQLMKEKNIYIGLYWPTVYDAKFVNLKQKEPVTSEKFIIANMYWE